MVSRFIFDLGGTKQPNLWFLRYLFDLRTKSIQKGGWKPIQGVVAWASGKTQSFLLVSKHEIWSSIFCIRLVLSTLLVFSLGLKFGPGRYFF